jgi:hypothetical protein
MATASPPPRSLIKKYVQLHGRSSKLISLTTSLRIYPPLRSDSKGNLSQPPPHNTSGATATSHRPSPTCAC